MYRYRILLAALVFFGNTLIAQTVNKAKLDSLLQSLESHNKGMGSLAISKNGNILYARAVGFVSEKDQQREPATIHSKYRVGSISKMFTAVIIFRLIEEHKLSIDEKLDRYFPAIPNAPKISLSELLNHRSGIHNFTDDSSYQKYYLQEKSKDELVTIIASAPPDFEPGSKAQYSNSNYVLLAYIATAVSGKPYRELVKKYVSSKIGLTDTYVGGKTNTGNQESYSYSFITNWQQEPETAMSIPGGAGAIVSTPADLVKFIEALFYGKLVNAEHLQIMRNIRDGYGMGMFEIPFYNRKAYGHSGGIDGFGSMVAFFPKDSLAVAYCTNGQVYPINDIMIGVLSIYFNLPYKIPSFKPGPAITDPGLYEGDYSSTALPLKISIFFKDSNLMAQATGQAAFALQAEGNDVFTFSRAGIEIRFDTANHAFTLKQGGKNYFYTREK